MMYDSKIKITPSIKHISCSEFGYKPLLGHNGDYIVVVSLSGFLNREDVKNIENIIDGSLKSGIYRFVLNFSDVNHIHYKAVDPLLHTTRKLDKKKGEIKFVARKPYLIDILFFGGWPTFYDFYPSEKRALEAFRKEYSLTWRKDVYNTYPSSS
jgi:anti-anti-sigma regulatory factor